MSNVPKNKTYFPKTYFPIISDPLLEYSPSHSQVFNIPLVEINLNMLTLKRIFFDFNDQIDALISKANQQLGLLRRTCHFVQDIKRRHALYLTLVRSQFEQ
jgi:hypothetical protein